MKNLKKTIFVFSSLTLSTYMVLGLTMLNARMVDAQVPPEIQDITIFDANNQELGLFLSSFRSAPDKRCVKVYLPNEDIFVEIAENYSNDAVQVYSAANTGGMFGDYEPCQSPTGFGVVHWTGPACDGTPFVLGIDNQAVVITQTNWYKYAGAKTALVSQSRLDPFNQCIPFVQSGSYPLVQIPNPYAAGLAFPLNVTYR